jgi:hypothetical protein
METIKLQQAGKSAILEQSEMQGQLPEEWLGKKPIPFAVERKREYSNKQLKWHLE